MQRRAIERAGRRIQVTIARAGVTTMLVAGCGGDPAVKPTLVPAHDLSVAVQVDGVDLAGVPGQVQGDRRSARAGFEVGTEIVIRDGDGDRIATTQLGRGRGVNRNGEFFCRLRFTTPVPDVPTYTASVHDLVIATWTHADLEDAEWTSRIDIDDILP